MRSLTRSAVCLACVIMATGGAEAGPIQISDPVLRSYVDASVQWSSAFRDQNARVQWFREDDDWLARYALTHGKAQLVEWNDRAAFLGAVGAAAIAWTWSLPQKPEKDQPAGVPEPATLVLFGLGAVALARAATRRTGVVAS
jgi:hypothetical protein